MAGHQPASTLLRMIKSWAGTAQPPPLPEGSMDNSPWTIQHVQLTAEQLTTANLLQDNSLIHPLSSSPATPNPGYSTAWLPVLGSLERKKNHAKTDRMKQLYSRFQ